MSDRYVIQWVSKVNGRTGRGTKTFSQQAAERLARELNEDYPDIQHDIVPAESTRHPPRPAFEREHQGSATKADYAMADD